MNLAPKRILLGVLACGLFLLSQNLTAQESGNVLVNTNPQGSLVKMTGELTLSGVTPVKFDRNLSGRYRIEVIREGYEKYRSTAYFSETQASQLDINLTPKTRIKAFFRSVIIPGWGQKYYGNSTKATLFGMATIASAIGYAFVKDDYDSKLDKYNDRKSAFENATLYGDLPRLEAAMWDAQEEANDAEDMVNIMMAVTAGVYLVNVLDSFLLFPDFDRYTEYKAITAVPEVDAEKVGVRLSVSF